MFELILISTFISLVAGLIIAIVFWRLPIVEKITPIEFLVGSAIIIVLIAPLTGCVGWNAAQANARVYHENWNGWETDAVDNHITCVKNGSCKYTYDCDCHWVQKCVARDKDGNCTMTIWVEECDSSCPYFNYERDLSILTTLGPYYIGRYAPPNYREEMKKDKLPSGFGKDDYVIPQVWLDCQARIAAYNPGPVTKRMDYDNFILASDMTILKEYSDFITEYKDGGLLPKFKSEVDGLYSADRMYFVGIFPQNATSWQESLSRLNAGLGDELQGDLHLIVTQNSTISDNPMRYITALKAYWQDSKEFGKNALSKNTILVVVGTEDGLTASWGIATTGMPVGNTSLTGAIRDGIAGTKLTPESLIGTVKAEFYTENNKKKVVATHGNGFLENVLWGIDKPHTRFTRVSMAGGDPDDNGNGFLYLESEIQPSGGQKWAIGIVIFFLSLPIWVVMIVFERKTNESLRTPRDYFGNRKGY